MTDTTVADRGMARQSAPPADQNRGWL